MPIQNINRLHFLVHSQAVQTGNGNSCGLRIDGGSVDDTLVNPIAHNLHMIAHMDLQSAINLWNQLPCPISHVHDFKARAALEKCGYATVVCMWRQSKRDLWLWTRRVAVYCHYLDSFSHFAAQVEELIGLIECFLHHRFADSMIGYLKNKK